MVGYMTVEVSDDQVSNVRYRAQFRTREIEPDPDSITGRIPGHVMRLAAAIQAVGLAGACSVFEIVRDGDGDAIDIIGAIALEEDGTIEWRPSGGSVDGPIVAALDASPIA
jgi:hypothetical protein